MSDVALPGPAAVQGDPGLPTLPAALDPVVARDAFADACPAPAHRPPIAGIAVLWYRPGRRCLLRYRFADGTSTIIGKLTAKGVHRRGLAVQRRLRLAGFDDAAADRIAVPEPLGAVPTLGLWLQREVPGRPLQACLAERGAVLRCARAAMALVKLHRQPAGPETLEWTIADELAVLDAPLGELAGSRPELAPTVAALRARCHAAAARLPPAPACGIHRDFYPEQLIVDGDRLHLVDLDLYSRGDPALDAGNFIAHLLEAAIRAHGDAAAYAALVAAFRAFPRREHRHRAGGGRHLHALEPRPARPYQHACPRSWPDDPGCPRRLRPAPGLTRRVPAGSAGATLNHCPSASRSRPGCRCPSPDRARHRARRSGGRGPLSETSSRSRRAAAGRPSRPAA